MNTEENFHHGHRQRLKEKVKANREVLSDHELLEAVLFYSIPRADTNPLAHRLLKVFGGLGGIARASKAELLAIDGVGEKTAELLLLFGEICVRAKLELYGRVEYKNDYTLKREFIKEFLGQTFESCLLVLLDKNYRKLAQLPFGNLKEFEVAVDLNEIARAFTSFKPTYALLAHNHVDGPCYPSHSDDVATKRIFVICRVHGVNLLDHVIVKGEDGYYSYRSDYRMDMIKQQSNIDKILEIGEKEYGR